ncbi:MAG: 5'-deoxyadenosine deaminase [Ignavibacteriae bacterium]|nr:5'-deoxyadenosine deaminase [Ignavibacteriota bacterium]
MVSIICVDNIVTGNVNTETFQNSAIVVRGNHIINIIPQKEISSVETGEIVRADGCTAIPGFIQTHVHLCQTLFRGMADDLELLDWLRLKIFPLEAAHNSCSMYSSAMLGIAELIRSGTTTILDMGSVHHEEEIILAIGETGLRAFVGKAMMDVNDLYPKLKEPTTESLRSTRELAERWHNSYDGRIKYAMAPRFILSCTDKLLREAYEMASSSNGMLFHTHASENKNEIDQIRQRCKMENIEYLHHLGVLSERSCLAHCVHVNEREVDLLRSTSATVAHCPSSNLKLGSGIANIPYLINMGVHVSLGADGAPCNNTLSMFQEMRLASLLQKSLHGATAMSAKKVFEMATLGGARVLGLGHDIGSIEVGKKADIVLLNLERIWNPLASDDDPYSTIVYSAGPENVDSVMIDGRWVYRKGEFVNIDEGKIMSETKRELKTLLERAEFS